VSYQGTQEENKPFN